MLGAFPSRSRLRREFYPSPQRTQGGRPHPPNLQFDSLLMREMAPLPTGGAFSKTVREELTHEMKLTERDLYILKLVNKFRFALGKHIMTLAGFTGLRATDRRLRALIDAGYLARKRYLHGVSYLYTLTHKGRILLGANKREDKIRIDRIMHDIRVLESVIFYIFEQGVALADIESEKELHIKGGFGVRKHHPDFTVNLGGESVAVEVELNPKGKTRMEQNIRENYLNYDRQIWVTDDRKVLSMLGEFSDAYSNISVMPLEKVIAYAEKR